MSERVIEYPMGNLPSITPQTNWASYIRKHNLNMSWIAGNLGVSEDEMNMTLEECSKKLGVSMEVLASKMKSCSGEKVFKMGDLPDLKSTDNWQRYFKSVGLEYGWIAEKIGVSDMDMTLEECAKKSGKNMEELVDIICECSGAKQASSCCEADSPKKTWMNCYRDFNPGWGWGTGKAGVSSDYCGDELKNNCESEGFTWTWMKKRFGVSES